MITKSQKNNTFCLSSRWVNSEQGFVLLFAVVISSIILAVALGVSNIAFKELNFSTSSKNTNDAFFAADVGVECALYHDRSDINSFLIPPSSPSISCATGSVDVSGGASNASYTFVVTGLGGSGQGCAKVTVTKDNSFGTVETFINSKGFNVGNSGCNSSSTSRVERELQVTFDEFSNPTPPPPPPSGYYDLTVIKPGSGGGTVTSSPSGINCGATCVESFPVNTSVTLTATPDAGSIFSSWAGEGCSGTGNCVLSMTTSRSVSATFTTTGVAPTVSTNSATGVTVSSATLNGSANPNSLATAGWFRYDTSDPGICSDSFGTRIPFSGGTSLGSGSSPVAYSETPSGLSSNTTYYFCAVASSSAGMGFGNLASFTTSTAPAVPTVTTPTKSSIASTSATLGANVTSLGAPASISARGTCYGTSPNPTTNCVAEGGTTTGTFTHSRTGLTPSTLYYYRGYATNATGTGYSADDTFTTSVAVSAPTVVTNAATNLTTSSATLNGSANPNNASTTGWFRYSTTNPGSCNDSFGTRIPSSGGSSLGSGSSPVAYSQTPVGLSSNMTYYFCAIASNSVGTSYGSVVSFKTKK